MKFVKGILITLMVGLLSSFAFAQETTKASPQLSPAGVTTAKASPSKTAVPAHKGMKARGGKKHHKKVEKAVAPSK